MKLFIRAAALELTTILKMLHGLTRQHLSLSTQVHKYCVDYSVYQPLCVFALQMCRKTTTEINRSEYLCLIF